jgi:hypothetical protein
MASPSPSSPKGLTRRISCLRSVLHERSSVTAALWKILTSECGKTEAEKIAYFITVAAWVLFPFATSQYPVWSSCLYAYVVAIVIGIFTVLSVFSQVKFPGQAPKPAKASPAP